MPTRQTVFQAAAVAGACALTACHHPTPTSPLPGVRAAAFVVDVTPPLGHPLCGGWIRPAEAVEDPLLAKGVVLARGSDRYVLCSVDWCLLQTGAHDAFREALAEAVGTPPKHVTVHTVHQHNAPLADSEAERLLGSSDSPPRHLDLRFLTNVTRRLGAAARDAGQRLQPISHVGWGQARVERFASNRRVRLPDGKIHVRYSATRDPVLQAAPEGLTDPWLRTVTLFNGEQPVVRLHYYATHPMSYYGDGRVTSDTVGLARAAVERSEGIPQIYFTGCGGNITAGKYNDGSAGARARLTARLHSAMTNAIGATTRMRLDRFQWRTVPVELAPRREPEWNLATNLHNLGNTNLPDAVRIQAALNAAWCQRLARTAAVEVSALTLGDVTLLHLPGEAFIEYQLYAQSLLPGGRLAVAAYGESGPGYICCDASAAEGGYEPTMSRVGPPSEQALKRGIARLLSTGRPLPAPQSYPDKQHLAVWRDPQGQEHPVRTPAEWAARRMHILESMTAVMGPPPGPAPSDPPHFTLLEECDLGSYRRRRIAYESEPGVRVPAWLLLPHGRGRFPAMLALHQTVPLGKDEPAGLGGNTNLHYGHELAARGYVVLAPDYPGFGENHVEPYTAGYASTTALALRNHQRGVDLLASLPEVDAGRIGVIGHSLGGHNALFLAAADPRVHAVITSCGFNSFFKYMGGDLGGWSHRGYMPWIRERFGNDPRRMPFDFTEVVAAIAPRPLFIHAPLDDTNFEVSGVIDCLEAARPIYGLLGASAALRAEHPSCGHDFPRAQREAAYAWLDMVSK